MDITKKAEHNVTLYLSKQMMIYGYLTCRLIDLNLFYCS